MNGRKTKTQGFTLVELLIAMAIAGVIIMAVLSWQLASTDASIRSNALVQSLSELNDLTGYVGDRVRSAEGIRVNDFKINGKVCDSTTPCLALLAPQDRGASDRKWLYLVYRLEKRADWTSVYKVENAWADKAENKIMVLREYRKSCDLTAPGVCDSFKTAFVSLADFDISAVGLVTDFLTSTDQAGTAIVPFAKTGSAVELKFQYKQPVQGKATYLPRTGPYTLTVQARNVE
jgi:prepilin-type N-terminal cleavage/methylation domain-containing protein